MLKYVLALATALFLLAYMTLHQARQKTLEVYVPGVPSTLDPIKFDFFKNHVPQSLVHSRLVTFYRGAGVSPQLAESWSSDAGEKAWQFKIRKNMRFGDGSPIDAATICLSLKRTIFVLKKLNSHNQIVTHIEGIENYNSLGDSLSGLSCGNGSVNFIFSKRVPNVLELLAFGVFSIVRQSDFDSVSGDWRTPLAEGYNSSGPYEVKSISEGRLLFAKRVDADAWSLSESAADEIAVDSKKSGINYDILFGPDDAFGLGDRYVFHGRGSRNIAYLTILPWKARGIFSDKKFREKMRQVFYLQLEADGLRPSRSFFPLIMKGVSTPAPVTEVDFDISVVKGMSISFNDVRPSPSSRTNLIISAFERAILAMGMVPRPNLNATADTIHSNKDPEKLNFDLDVAILGTGISIEDPQGDVRLMFSPEGVWLPDSNGRIHQHLRKAALDIQSINEEVWGQSIVWPIIHYDLGLWTKNDLNFSEYNLTLPLGELQWIGVE